MSSIIAAGSLALVDRDLIQDEPVAKKARTGFQCEICSTSYTESRALTRHRQTDYHRRMAGLPFAQKYACSTCNKQFSRDFDRVRHENEQHKGLRRPNANRQNVPNGHTQHQDSLTQLLSMQDDELAATEPAYQQPPAGANDDEDHYQNQPGSLDSDTIMTGSNSYFTVDSAMDLGQYDASSVAASSDGHGKVASVSELPNGELAEQRLMDIPMEEVLPGGLEDPAETAPNLALYRYPEKPNPRPLHPVAEEEQGRVGRKSLIHRHGRMTVASPQREEFCTFCDTPFEEILEELMSHLRRHLDVLTGSHLCADCQIEFVHSEDLEMHKAAASRGHCAFGFPHLTDCHGHHPPSPESQMDLMSDWDGLRLCTRLRDWDQAQLHAYMASVSRLLKRRNERDTDMYSIEVLMRQSQDTLESFAISDKTLASAPCDMSIRSGTRDVRGLQRRLRIMSVRRSSVRQQATQLAQIAQIAKAGSLARYIRSAVEEQDMAKVKKALEYGGDVNVKMANGQHALHVAVAHGNIELLRLLLAFGADPEVVDQYDSTVLSFATGRCHLEIVRELLLHGSSARRVHGDAIYEAATHRELDIVKLLIQAGAEINQTALGCQALLCRAAFTDNLEAVESLLECGANANARCRSHGNVLSSALSGASLVVVRRLIEHGADVDEGPSCNISVYGGPLERGLHIDEVSNSKRPMCLAMLRGSGSCVKLLLHSGAGISACVCTQHALLDGQALRGIVLEHLLKTRDLFSVLEIAVLCYVDSAILVLGGPMSHGKACKYNELLVRAAVHCETRSAQVNLLSVALRFDNNRLATILLHKRFDLAFPDLIKRTDKFLELAISTGDHEVIEQLLLYKGATSSLERHLRLAEYHGHDMVHQTLVLYAGCMQRLGYDISQKVRDREDVTLAMRDECRSNRMLKMIGWYASYEFRYRKWEVVCFCNR